MLNLVVDDLQQQKITWSCTPFSQEQESEDTVGFSGTFFIIEGLYNPCYCNLRELKYLLFTLRYKKKTLNLKQACYRSTPIFRMSC